MDTAAMVPMAGKVCLVTGANIGIGFETARALAATGATVVLACRSKDKAEQAIREIQQLTGNGNLSWLPLDLSSLAAVGEAARVFRERHERLDRLVLNAGVLPVSLERTADGFESALGVNHLAQFLLTVLLLPRLVAAAPARVVTLSSLTHTMIEQVAWDDLSWHRTPFRLGSAAYAQSKLFNVMFAYELNRRFAPLGVYANATHPGVVATDILKDRSWFIRVAGTQFMRIIGRTVQQGAATAVWLCVARDLERVGGGYYFDCRPAVSSPLSHSRHDQRRLWDTSMQLVGADAHLLADAGLCDLLLRASLDDLSAVQPYSPPQPRRKPLLVPLLAAIAVVLVAVSVAYWYEVILRVIRT